MAGACPKTASRRVALLTLYNFPFIVYSMKKKNARYGSVPVLQTLYSALLQLSSLDVI